MATEATSKEIVISSAVEAAPTAVTPDGATIVMTHAAVVVIVTVANAVTIDVAQVEAILQIADEAAVEEEMPAM